jgi:hypothetical protein
LRYLLPKRLFSPLNGEDLLRGVVEQLRVGLRRRFDFQRAQIVLAHSRSIEPSNSWAR